MTSQKDAISFSLVAPAPDFLSRLAMPFFQAIPRSLARQVDPSGVNVIPSCGPYWVASRRYVPWFGNANQWIAGARAYGFAEGSTPTVGSIMVTAEGPIGHVAYVEAVHTDGSWTVSEMNFVAWNVVDHRTIHPGQVPFIGPGFIY